jgi:uncharacterized membrane protein
VGTRPLAVGLTLVCLLTATTFALVVRIAVETGENTHVFLLWNLMLAWVPLLFALALEWRRRRRRAGMPSLVLGVGWLLFLPNAPYLVTDLIHLGRKNADLSLALDLTTLLVAAATGTLIGFLSLVLVQRWIAERLGQIIAWTLAVLALAMTSFGIYLGRILRLNSWDILARPETFAQQVGARLGDPLAHPKMLAGTAAVMVCLVLFYVVFYYVAAALERRPA